MPEDDRGAESGHLPPAAEAVDQEGVQLLDARDAHVEQEVIAADENEHRHHLWHGCRILPAGALDAMQRAALILDIADVVGLPRQVSHRTGHRQRGR